jgi:hypothetical protein
MERGVRAITQGCRFLADRVLEINALNVYIAAYFLRLRELVPVAQVGLQHDTPHAIWVRRMLSGIDGTFRHSFEKGFLIESFYAIREMSGKDRISSTWP